MSVIVFPNPCPDPRPTIAFADDLGRKALIGMLADAYIRELDMQYAFLQQRRRRQAIARRLCIPDKA